MDVSNELCSSLKTFESAEFGYLLSKLTDHRTSPTGRPQAGASAPRGLAFDLCQALYRPVALQPRTTCSRIFILECDVKRKERLDFDVQTNCSGNRIGESVLNAEIAGAPAK